MAEHSVSTPKIAESQSDTFHSREKREEGKASIVIIANLSLSLAAVFKLLSFSHVLKSVESQIYDVHVQTMNSIFLLIDDSPL